MNQSINLKYIGPESYLDSLKKHGSPDTRSVNQLTYLDTDMETAATFNSNGEFGIDILLNKIKVGNDSTSLPPGLKLKGVVVGDSMPQIISVESSQMNESDKQAIVSMCQRMFSQISLPEKTLKKGESFIHEIPLKIPTGNSVLSVVIETKYTLMHVENNLATFLIGQTYKMNSKDSKNMITVTGEGDGELIFDLKESFYKKYQITTRMKMHINNGKVDAMEDINGYTELLYSISDVN